MTQRPELRGQSISVIKGYINTQMKTPDWHTMEWLNQRASRVNFVEVSRDLEEPKEAQEVRDAYWPIVLERKKMELLQANPSNSYTIHIDDQRERATNKLALFQVRNEGERVVTFDGPNITLAQQEIYQEGDKTLIPTYPILYSEWIACMNPDYAKAFRHAGLPIPYAGIGISVLMVTNDGAKQDDRTYGLIPLTRRGIETPVYPGRLYSPGGGPKPGQTPTEALLEEIIEETGLKDERYYDSDDIFMLALIADTKFAGSEHMRPELVACLPVNATFSEIEKIQHEVSVKKGLPQEDVWGVVSCSAFTPNLARAIIFNGPEMCPPTEAGLTHLLLYQEMKREGLERALESMESFMGRIKSFKRMEFVPPIQRLAR